MAEQRGGGQCGAMGRKRTRRRVGFLFIQRKRWGNKYSVVRHAGARSDVGTRSEAAAPVAADGRALGGAGTRARGGGTPYGAERGEEALEERLRLLRGGRRGRGLRAAGSGGVLPDKGLSA